MADITRIFRQHPLAQAFLRHKTLLVGIFSVVFAAVVLNTLRSPTLYRSAASVLIETHGRSISGITDANGSIAPEAARAQRALAESRPVIARASEISGEALPAAGAFTALPSGFETRMEGQLLYLQVNHRDPAKAAKLANAWSDAYVEEMTQRAPQLEAHKILEKSLPELQKSWVARQEALNDFERKTNFHPTEFERSPVWKAVDEYRGRLNAKNLELVALRSELDVLEHASSPEDLLESSRAKSDAGIQSYRKLIEERRARLLSERERFKEGSAELRGVEDSLTSLLAEFAGSAKNLARQVQLETKKTEGERDRLNELLKSAEAQLDELKSRAATHKVLNAEAAMAEKLYSDIAQRKNENDLSQSFEYYYARPWEHAEAAKIPFSPNWKRSLSLGFAAALFFALGLAFLAERLDDTVRLKPEFGKDFGANLLGVIPEWNSRPKFGYSMIGRDQHSATADSIYNVCVGLDLARTAATSDSQIITITSATHGEGKSFIAANTAALFAKLGKKTLLIDADFRKSSLSVEFGAQGKAGFRDALKRGRFSKHGVVPTEYGYDLLPAGTDGENPWMHIRPEPLRQILKEISAEYDIVILDTSPVLALSDVCVIAQMSDVNLIVSRSGVTRTVELERAARRLQETGARRLDFVVNAVAAHDTVSYYQAKAYVS